MLQKKVPQGGKGKPIPKTTKGTNRNYLSTKEGAGMTKKGVQAYRAANPNSKLQTAVTEKSPTGSRAARRRSFCARMSGVPGPTSKDGKLTRKGASLKRWRC